MSPDGQCLVLGPALSKNLLTNRILANVPRAITASFPLRDPYELNSLGVRLMKKTNPLQYIVGAGESVNECVQKLT